MDDMTDERWQQALALLALLALGTREIEEGRFRDATDVFADFDREAS
ncbi:hypothetical protein [Massilia cavernae]|nr:hypothetical protein [Massilia cavernae]